MLTEGALFTFVAGLFVIMNPVGNVAVFASLTTPIMWPRDFSRNRATPHA
jgi:small neutral amino acid transporter SnatA (MarC family)